MEDELLAPPIVLFFRFPSEEEGMAALDTAGFVADGQVITASHNHALDVVGTITRGGDFDDEGNLVTPPTVLLGWHINYIGDLPPEWEQYKVNPRHPARIFA